MARRLRKCHGALLRRGPGTNWAIQPQAGTDNPRLVGYRLASRNDEPMVMGSDATRKPVADAEYVFAISRHDTPELCWKLPRPRNRGRREDRVRAAPAVSCANSAKQSCTRAYRAAENTRPSLRNGFTAYNAISPVGPCSLPPSPLGSICFSANLTPAYGASQDHASLPYAQAALVSRNLSVHRNPSNVRDDGRRPSE